MNRFGRLMPHQLLGIAVILVLIVQASALAARPPGKGKQKPDTASPAVAIVDPAPGSTVSGSVTVSGTASDNVQVASVEVSVDGGAFRTASGTTSWSYPLDTTAYADGEHTVTTRAVDPSGNTATASGTLAVSNTVEPPPPPPPPPADTTPPTVAVATPAAGATVSGRISVSGTASDDVGVAAVEVSVDGGPYQPASGTANWSYSLDTTAYADGSHTLHVRAADAAGNPSSTSVGVTVKNTAPPPSGAQTLATPEGATIEVAADVTGWTAQQVYDLLKPNAYELSRIGPNLTIKVQKQYASSTSTGVSEVGGVYQNFQATIYLDARAGRTFGDRPDYVVAHEYGHVWTTYHLYMSQGGNWPGYLSVRGIAADPRLDSTYNWSKTEMVADDYRLLFGTQTAQSQAAYINPDVPDPRAVPGLKDWFVTGWASS